MKSGKSAQFRLARFPGPSHDPGHGCWHHGQHVDHTGTAGGCVIGIDTSRALALGWGEQIGRVQNRTPVEALVSLSKVISASPCSASQKG